MILQSASRKYLREAGRYLIGSKQRRAQFIQLIGESIAACDDDETEIGYTELVQTLGQPKTYVENLLCAPDYSREMLESAWKERRRKRAAVFAALLASAAAVALVLLGGFYLRYSDSMAGDFIIEKTVDIQPDKINPEGMSPEEFKAYMIERFETEWQRQLEEKELEELHVLLENQDLYTLIELLENYDLSELRELMENYSETEEGAGET